MKYSMVYKSFFVVALMLFLKINALAQLPDHLRHLDIDLSREERIELLLNEMTLEEKIGQMVYSAPAIDRLGVSAYNWWNEALHGVARSGYATVFPQSITIAGSFDTNLMYRVATVISDEARAKHHEMERRGKRGIYQGLTFWSPNINIFRDPRWGRGHETYGEDPFLTGKIGAGFVRGLQGDHPDYLKVVATAKHYAVHSGPEPLRHEFNARVSDRDLFETYLPAFKRLVTEANVYSFMCAYNQFRDHPACANPYLYNILRNEWGFNGYIVSDCWAISDFFRFQGYSADAAEASAIAVRAGTDLNCGNSYPRLKQAIERGLITEDEIDVSVRRLLEARFRLGMFDPQEAVPYAQIPFSVNGADVHATLAREAAQKSIVLLKNSNDILPLGTDIKTLAVIGPNADNWEALLGNYNGIAKNPVTVLQGIKNKLEPKVTVLHAEGSHLAEGVHNLVPVPSVYLRSSDGRQGLTGSYYANVRFEGDPQFIRLDDNIDFYWESHAPSPDLPDDDFSVRWSGYILPPITGTYQLGCWGMPTLDVWVEDEKILSHNTEHHAFHHERPLFMEAGKAYKIVYEYRNWYGDGDVRLLWSMPGRDLLNEALEVAEKADAVLLVLGLSQRLEGEEMELKVDGFEGGDRTHLNLPTAQEELLQAVHQTGKPLIVVLLNGSALSVNYAATHANAILTAGYPGEQGGNAVADVLTGAYNPAGRLPVTYYASVDQLPPFDEYDMHERTYRYFTGEPLFPFGHGLSYTSFGYSNLQLPKQAAAGEAVSISVKVTNTGYYAGDEVVQLYLTDEVGSTPRPIRQLEGFKRISLKAGESQEVYVSLDPEQFSMINTAGDRVIEPGWFTITVGGKQPGFKGLADATTTETISGRIRLTGRLFKFGVR